MPISGKSLVTHSKWRFDTSLAVLDSRCKLLHIKLACRARKKAVVHSSPFFGKHLRSGNLFVEPSPTSELMALFVRVDIGFYTHRKTLRLFTKIGESAYWVPPRIWAYAADQQVDGEFEKYTAEEIAMLIGYKADATSMLQALIDSGFMDVNPLRIHDWSDHNGFHAVFSERAKKAARARWAKEKERTKEKEDTEEKETETEKYQASPSIASSIGEPFKLTDESNIKHSKAKGTRDEVVAYARESGLLETDGQWFFEKCEGCGWKNNKEPIRDWRATMRSWKLVGTIFPSQKGSNGINGKPHVKPNYERTEREGIF